MEPELRCDYCGEPANDDSSVAVSTFEENKDFCSKFCAAKWLFGTTWTVEKERSKDRNFKVS